MKYFLVFSLALVAVCALPKEILNFEGDNHEHEQEGEAGHSVTGEYRWESPEGHEFVVKYIADDKGYRILESNAVPSSADGVAAGGNQGNLDGGDDGNGNDGHDDDEGRYNRNRHEEEDEDEDEEDNRRHYNYRRRFYDDDDDDK